MVETTDVQVRWDDVHEDLKTCCGDDEAGGHVVLAVPVSLTLSSLCGNLQTLFVEKIPDFDRCADRKSPTGDSRVTVRRLNNCSKNSKNKHIFE